MCYPVWRIHSIWDLFNTGGRTFNKGGHKLGHKQGHKKGGWPFPTTLHPLSKIYHQQEIGWGA